MKIKIDPEDLTFGDMEDFEAVAEMPIFEAFQALEENRLPMKGFIGLVWVCHRRSDPDFTLEDARKVRLREVEFEGPEGQPDPTSGSGDSI